MKTTLSLLPNDFYKWYRPIRESYQVIAEELLREEWEKLKKKSKVLKEIQQYIPTPELEAVPTLPSSISRIECSVKR